MTQLGCFNQVMACRTRVTRLSAAGVPLIGANNLVVSGLVRIEWEPQTVEGSLITKEDGCGNTCLRRQAPDKVGGLNLTMEFCAVDYELEEMLTGALLIMDDGLVVGSQMPDFDTELTNRVMIEAWGELWDGDERAYDDDDNPLWVRQVFPKTSWVPAPGGAAASARSVVFTGRAFSNSNAGLGPDADWPQAITHPRGEFVDAADLPDANCGYLLASGS